MNPHIFRVGVTREAFYIFLYDHTPFCIQKKPKMVILPEIRMEQA